MNDQYFHLQDRKIVGKITPEERDEIKRLFERKNSLLELFKTLTNIENVETAKLYEKIVIDMAQTTSKFQNWFDVTSKKYSWENIPGYNWQVDFETCEVYLQK